MPNSLRSKLSSLRYKKIITDKEYERLKNGLDTVDAIKKIKEKINYEAEGYIGGSYGDGLYKALEIIDEYLKEKEPSYHKVSYDQALDGMKSEYPTGKELDAFLEYKRDKKEAKNDIG